MKSIDDWEIKSSDQHINSKDAIDLILDFNENKNEDEYENEDEDDYYENENEYEDDDDKTIDQNEIKKINDYFDKIIDKSKSFEDQIKSLKKDLKKYVPHKDYDDKELKYKYFKIKLADMSNEIVIWKKLFGKIFGHALIKLVDKLISTTNKEDSQIIVKNINVNKKNLQERKKTKPYDYVIEPTYRRINLMKAIKFILDFNESKLKDLVQKIEKLKNE